MGRLVGFLRFLIALPGILLALLWGRLRGRPLHVRWTWSQEMAVRIVRWAVGMAEGASPATVRARIPVAPRRFLPHGVTNVDGELAGRPTEVTTPVGWTPEDPTVLYLHGGGYGVCSPATHRDLIARFAHQSGARCVALDYRLAPDHPYPAALDDADAATTALLETVPAERLLIAGDSAGGGLAIATLIRRRDEGKPLPAGGVLFSPWVDLTLSGSTIESNAATDYLTRGALESYSKHYACEEETTCSGLSPVFAEFEGIPPLLIQAGEAELLCDEVRTLAGRAEEAGVDVTLEVDEAMPHVHQAFAQLMPQGAAALERAGRWVRAKAPRGQSAA